MNTRLETMWASLMFVAIGVALASGAVFSASLNYGRRWLAWFSAAVFIASTLVAAYSFWRWA